MNDSTFSNWTTRLYYFTSLIMSFIQLFSQSFHLTFRVLLVLHLLLSHSSQMCLFNLSQTKIVGHRLWIHALIWSEKTIKPAWGLKTCQSKKLVKFLIRMCGPVFVSVWVCTLTQRLFWNKFSGDKPLMGVGVWPLDSLIYLAMLDGSDEMTTKIKPQARTWGIPNCFLTR